MALARTESEVNSFGVKRLQILLQPNKAPNNGTHQTTQTLSYNSFSKSTVIELRDYHHRFSYIHQARQ